MTVSSYPCGAHRAWSTVVGTFLILFVATGNLPTFGVFQEFYTMTWLSNYSASTISWIGSTQVFFEFSLGMLGGKLYDAGYGRPMLLSASVLFTFSYVMLSFAKPGQYYQVFLSQGIGFGISLGLFYTPSCTLVTEHFKSNPALVVGIILAGGPLGGVAYTIMLNYMINSSFGFAWSVRALALLSAVCLLVANLLITIPPRQKIVASERKASLKSMRDLPYILVALSSFFWLLDISFPILFIQLYASMHNVSRTLIFYSLAIIHFVAFLSRIAVNAFAKTFGAINLSIISCVLHGCALFGMLGANTAPGIVLFSIFYGIFFGSTVSLYPSAVAYFVPSDADIGTVLGFAWGPGGIASLVGPPLSAALLGSDYVWIRGICFSGGCFIVAAALQLAAKQIHVNRLKRQSESGSQTSSTASQPDPLIKVVLQQQIC